MANPTTNYGFVLPTATDLVTDLPADFDVALQGVDTRLKALQPGTTLGDIAYSSATANTNTRLAIGSTGNVLTVSGGVPAWAAPAGGGKMLQVVQGTKTTTSSTASGAASDTGLTVTITPTLATSKVLVMASFDGETRNGTSSTTNQSPFLLLRGATQLQERRYGSYNFATASSPRAYAPINFSYLDSPATVSATTYKIQYMTDGSNLNQMTCSATSIASIIAIEVGA